jgi:hypothetical protein
MNTRMRSVRGPAVYAAGGFLVTLGDIERISVSSGRLVSAATVSSSPMVAQVVNASGNVATVILRDQRSGGLEPTAGDFSGLHVNVLYEGV